MDWFRHYNTLSSDPKLTLAGEMAGVHHAFAVTAWCFVLEHANAQNPRGVESNINVRLMALSTRIDADVCERLLEAFRELRMVVDGRVRAWDTRQFKSDDAYERVKRFRGKGGTVSGNASETFQKRPRTEQTQKQKKPPIAPLEGGETDEFKRFWQMYPRRVSKGAALRAWPKALKRVTHDEIMKGLARAIASWKDREPEFIPHPATWLNQHGWADEPPERPYHDRPKRDDSIPW